MRNYEFTVIFDADEEKTKKGLADIDTLFKAENVTITKQDDMGIRQLAYVIKKNDKGHYYYYELSADPASIHTFEQKFVLNATILKFLFVNTGK
jgi:small subunit ribosomal protein S6